MARLIWISEAVTEPMPDEVKTYIAPVPYRSLSFCSGAHAAVGRCSLCLQEAVTMARGRQRLLALCDMRDRSHRWVREALRRGWWYLPPPLQNSGGGWWRLKYHNTGIAGGEAGWYLHEFQGRRVIDTYARTFHIARSTAERILPALNETPLIRLP
jgi:hypothetical protein